MYSQRLSYNIARISETTTPIDKNISRQYLHNENVSGDAALWRHNKFKMATVAILKIAKSPYLSEKSSDFDQIWYTTADIEPNDSHVTKNWIF